MQGPRLYRFFNYELPDYLPAPTEGWNPDAQPWELPVSQAPQLDNFLIRPGKIVMRHPFQVFSDYSSLTPGNVCGWNDASGIGGYIDLTRKVVSATAYIDNWNAPLLKPTSNTKLAAAAANSIVISSAGAVSSASASLAGPRSCYYDGNVYFIRYSAATSATGPNGLYTIWKTSLVQSSNVSNVDLGTAAPTGAFDVKGYQSRIWLLGGVDTAGAGTTHSPTSLYFTIPGGGGVGSTQSDWRDPVAGTSNIIKMDNNDSDYGVALAVVRGGLLILRRRSIWLLRGSTTANYALIPISREIGCVDARSVVETDHGVYFMSLRGLMLTNGTTIANVSGSVLHTLQQAIAAQQQAVLSGFGGHITCTLLSQGQLLVSIGTAHTTAGAPDGHVSPIWCGLYDVNAAPGGVWSRITSQLWASDGIQVAANFYPGQVFTLPRLNRTFAAGDIYLTDIENVAAGLSIATAPGLYDKLPSGGNPYVSIPAVWKTTMPAVTTSSRRTFGHAKRWYFDYVFAAQGLVPTVGWSIAPVDGTGAALVDSSGNTSERVPAGTISSTNGFVSGVTPITGSAIQRFNQDFVPEIGDAQFVVTWSDSPRAAQVTSAAAEIYGLGLEFQHSRERR